VQDPVMRIQGGVGRRWRRDYAEGYAGLHYILVRMLGYSTVLCHLLAIHGTFVPFDHLICDKI